MKQEMHHFAKWIPLSSNLLTLRLHHGVMDLISFFSSAVWPTRKSQLLSPQPKASTKASNNAAVSKRKSRVNKAPPARRRPVLRGRDDSAAVMRA